MGFQLPTSTLLNWLAGFPNHQPVSLILDILKVYSLMVKRNWNQLSIDTVGSFVRDIIYNYIGYGTEKLGIDNVTTLYII